MTTINVIITNIGLAKMASATSENPLMIEKFAVGDGELNLSSPQIGNMVELMEEKYRDFVSDVYTKDNEIIVECILRGNAPIEKGFYLKELGLFDKEGALIAIAKLPQSYRPALIEGNILTENIFNVGLKLENSEHIAISVPENIFVSSDNLAREVQILDNKIDNLHSNDIKLSKVANFGDLKNIQEALDALYIDNRDTKAEIAQLQQYKLDTEDIKAEIAQLQKDKLSMLEMNRGFYKMLLGVAMTSFNDINIQFANYNLFWLAWCEGQSLLVAEYPDLYRVLGNRWGGVPNVNFNLPDSRNRVIRNIGADMPWSYQEDAGQKITGYVAGNLCIYDAGNSLAGTNNGCVKYGSKFYKASNPGVLNSAHHGIYDLCIDSALVARTSHETRVKSLPARTFMITKVLI